PDIGLPSSSVSTISIQCRAVGSRLKGSTGASPYFPVCSWRCWALVFSTSPGSALSASCACVGSPGETRLGMLPDLGLAKLLPPPPETSAASQRPAPDPVSPAGPPQAREFVYPTCL